MFYNLGKKIFKLLVNASKFLQVSFIFLAFFIILYWLFELGEATFIEPFTPFFQGIKNFVHLFYTRTVEVDQVKIDFAFLIASFLSILLAWAMKYVISFIEDSEKQYDKIYNFIKKRAEKFMNLALEKEYLFHEYQNNNFLILIKFDLLNLAKDSFFHKDADLGLREKQREILLKFGEELDKKIPSQKRYLNEGLLLYFNPFKQVDSVLDEIAQTITLLKKKYYEEKWQIEACLAIDTYAQEKEILDKIRNIVMLVRLGIKDRIVCLSTFKQRYELSKTKKYSIETKGVYKINESEESVFVLKA